MNDTTNAGTVVHIKFLICANKSVSEIDDAKFVESDNGELLSPKIAPDNTAPATNAGSKPIAVPTPIKATPTVASVVNADPIIEPTIAVTKTALGKNQAAFAILKPIHSIVGMTFVPIHNAISIPINRNKNNGAKAVCKPLNMSR